MYYVGLFKNKTGYGRLFTTKKNVTAERFPFFKKVYAFEDKEGAEKFFKKKGLKAVTKKKGVKKGKKAVVKARKLEKQYTEWGRKLASARKPSTKLKYKKKLLAVTKLLKVEQRENPGREWHTKERDVSSIHAIEALTAGETNDATFNLGKGAGHQNSIDAIDMGVNPATMSRREVAEHVAYLQNKINLAIEDRNVGLAKSLNARVNWILEAATEEGVMLENPLGASMIIAGNPIATAKRDFLISKLNGFHTGYRNARSLAEKSLMKRQINYYKSLLKEEDAKLDPCSKNPHRGRGRRLLRKGRRLRSNPPSSSTEIYGEILAIEARKGNHGEFPNENFRHDFKKGGKIYGLPNGDLLVKVKDGNKLWESFDY